ncbi:RNA-binding protein 44 [Salminus brasiliensis]|uniref:RNA-binding protein 44 n=1 Tax=Salminus brasiliensis TaxID=930266 RepID=UPI003B832F49
MWYPPPILVPCYLGPYSSSASDVSATMMWQMMPFDQQMCFSKNGIVGCQDCPSTVEDGRIFLLKKSVFDLVKVSHCLELTDPKLLGWYLSLPAEDRKLIQEEGGFLHFLQRHPALEVNRHIIHLKHQVLRNQFTLEGTDMSSKLRHPTFYGATQCLNCGTSSPSGAKKCRRCNMPVLNPEENVCASEDEQSLGLLPNSVKEELNLLRATRPETSVRSVNQLGRIRSISSLSSAPRIAAKNAGHHGFGCSHPAQTYLCQQQMHSTEAQYLSQMWEERMWNDETDVRICKDPSAQASFSLDMELEKQCHSQKPDLHHVQSLDTSTDFSNLNQETLPEYYSLNSTGLEQCNAAAELQEPSCSDSLLATKGSTEVSTVDDPVESSLASSAENCTFPDSVSCNSSEWTDYTEDYQDLSNEDDSACEQNADEYRSLIDGSSSEAFASQVPSSRKSINPSRSGSRSPERVSTPEESFLSAGENELNVHVKLCEKYKATSVLLRVDQAVDAISDFRACFTSTKATGISPKSFVKPCRDVSAGTDSFPVTHEKETQTIQMSTSEKNMITEVHMSDLDVLSEEFEYLRMIEEELKHLKDKMARSSSSYAEAPGKKGQCSDCGCDSFHRARRAELRLLALQFTMCQQHCWRCFYTSPLGESALHGTEALSGVVSQTLKTLEDDYLEMKRKVLDGIHLEGLKPLSVDTCRIIAATRYSPALLFKECFGDVLNEDSPRSDHNLEDQPDQANQDIATTSAESKGGVSKRCRAVCVLNQQLVVSRDAWPGVPKDHSSPEDWFDAQEELGSTNQGCREKQTVRPDGENSKLDQNADRNGKADQSSLLCVTDLPRDITECELLLLFEQYNASQVSLTTFSRNDRAAIVGVRNPCDADAAVREVNGRSIQGHTVRVEHIHWSPAGCWGPIKASRAECFPAACKAAPAEEGLSMHSSKRNSHFSRPLRCSLDKLINIYDKPTASGTCVPQHYATMGSFDTLMARLTERHPEVSRERIVAALLELRVKHQGYLSGLPLRTIVDMTSGLLMQPPTTV